MKKFLCFILSVLTLTGSLSTVCAFAVEQEEELISIDEIIEKINTDYGENPFSDAADSGSWDYEYVEDNLVQPNTVINLGGSVANPQWGVKWNDQNDESKNAYGTHGYIIDKADEIAKTYKDSQGNSPYKIENASYKTLVKEISKRCDTEYGHKIDVTIGNEKYTYYNHKFCSSFHGNGNYLATVSYLWNFSLLINTGKQIYGAPDNTDLSIGKYIDTISSAAFSSLPKKIRDDKNDTFDRVKYDGIEENDTEKVIYLVSLRDTSASMVKKYYKNNSIVNLSNYSWEKSCKYIIWGMLMHCIGDIYAHKVCLKTDAAYALDQVYNKNKTKAQINFNSSTMLDPDYFTKQYFKVDKLIYEVKNEKYEDVYKKGDIIIFKKEGPLPIFQIKKYIKGKNEIGSQKVNDLNKTSHTKYADNPGFYPERVSKAIALAVYFMVNYSKSNATKAQSIYNGINEGYNLTLFRIDYYKGEMNITT